MHDNLSATRASTNVGACVGDVVGDDVGLVVGDSVGSCAVVAKMRVQTTRAHIALMSCTRLAIAMTRTLNHIVIHANMRIEYFALMKKRQKYAQTMKDKRL